MYGDPKNQRAWAKAHQATTLHGRRSTSPHARARTAGRYLLLFIGGASICLAAIAVLCTADRLVAPAAAAEVSRG